MASPVLKNLIIRIREQIGLEGILAFLLVVTGFLCFVTGILIFRSEWFVNLLLSAKSFCVGRPPQISWVGLLHLRGVEAILLGLIAVVAGCLGVSRWRQYPSLAKKHSALLAMALLLLLWLPTVLMEKNATIGGEKYWWLHDDAMISMRYAHNLADGNGLVWNVGEYVEGYSNFLWTIYMASVHLFPIPISKTSLVILLTNILLSLATIPLIYKFVGEIGGRTLAVTSTLVAFALNRNVMMWTTHGMETSLLTLLFVLALYRIILESRKDRQRIFTYLIIAVISLVRADAAVLSALLYALALLLNKNKKLVCIYSVFSLLLPFAQEIFRICYYGEILPNTAYLKTMGWDGRFDAGTRYCLQFIRQYAFMILFAVVGSLAAKKRVLYFIMGGLVLYLAYVVYIGGDAFEDFRFFLPMIPILIALAFVGIQSFDLHRAVRLLLCLLCILTMPLVRLHDAAVSFLPIREGLPLIGSAGDIRIGLLIKQNTSAACKVADTAAGSTFYFSERYGIDLLGKTDPHIARLSTVSDGNVPGHNKFDFDYSLGILNPDLVIANFKLPVNEEKMQKYTHGDYAFIGGLYYHPLFRSEFLPNPIMADTWRTVFVSNRSSELENRFSWRIAGEGAYGGTLP